MKKRASGKFLDRPKSLLDFGFWLGVWQRINALLNGQIQDERGNVIGVIDYADANTIYRFKSSSTSSSIAGEWDPEEKYDAKVIVFFTPDGDYGRTFYSLQQVPAGISPDTGAPYWASFPMSPPGVWA